MWAIIFYALIISARNLGQCMESNGPIVVHTEAITCHLGPKYIVFLCLYLALVQVLLVFSLRALSEVRF